jgi:phospholipid/cholesterol/gamma-HCH transport system permease protein
LTLGAAAARSGGMSPVQESARRAPADLPDFAGGGEPLLPAVARFRYLARAPVQAALWQQVRRGALDFAGLTALLGALAGFFTIATVELRLGLGLTVGVLVLRVLVLGQLAGFVCALLLVAGPGTAATFELGLMRHHGELRTLRLIGIDPRDYLVPPRVLGFALALFVLTFVFQTAAALGGAALAVLVTPFTFTQQIEALAGTLAPPLVLVSAGKSLVLGAVIGLLVCHQGLVARFAPAQLPRIARQLLGRSLVALVLVHGGAALLLS